MVVLAAEIERLLVEPRHRLAVRRLLHPAPERVVQGPDHGGVHAFRTGDAEGRAGDEIDPDLAHTATLNAAFALPVEASANCVVVGGARAGDERIAAAVVRAHTRADVNTRIRKLLDVRKASFLPTDRATAESGMEYGGITPVGLPDGWRVLVDSRVVTDGELALIGSGVRRSKLLLPGDLLGRLRGVEVVEDLAVPVA